jgi:group I intron endonuclease
MGDYMLLCGIYTITNKVNGKYYLGSSHDIKTRLRTHRTALRRGIHYNSHLQRSWAKHGEKAFEFKQIASCKKEVLELVEQLCLDVRQPFPPAGYNISRCVEKTALGLKRSDETKKRLSDALRGKKHPNWGKPLPPGRHELMMKAVRGKKNPRCGKRKTITLISPEGATVVIDGIRRFCREHKFSSGNITSLINGKILSVGGWTIPTPRPSRANARVEVSLLCKNCFKPFTRRAWQAAKFCSCKCAGLFNKNWAKRHQ